MTEDLIIPPVQQDSAWKDVLQAYFPEFMTFFYPTIAAAIDWREEYQTLDKELQNITTDAMVGKRFVDKLLQVKLKNGQESWLLIHVEVQGAPEAEFSSRLFEYYYRIYNQYRKPIITLAILADSNPSWRPAQYQMKVLDQEIISFNFLSVKLLDYRKDEAMLETTTNPFGIILLAHLRAQDTRKDPESRFTSKYSITRELYDRGLTRDDVINLYKFIDWVMTLPKPLEIRYNQKIRELEEQRAVSYITSGERLSREAGFNDGLIQGIERGIEKGKQEGEYLFLLKQLEFKFGHLPNKYRQRLKVADTTALLTWGERILNATRLEEVFEIH